MSDLSPIDPRPILVTGVPGWLGTRFVELLARGEAPGLPLSQGRTVRCLVLPEADASDLSSLGSAVEIVRGDLRRPETLAPAVRGVGTVFHLAGIIHPRRIADLYALNTEGTRHLLAAAAGAGVRRLVHISSNSAGGVNERRDRLMREEDPPRPYLHYGRSKRLAEIAVEAFHREGRLETVILRPCWFYGVRQPARQTRFFRMIRGGRPIIFGSGENLRSMTYIDNAVQAMLLAERTASAAGQTYWIADERAYPVNEIYRTVAELLEVRSFRPRHVPALASTACLAADRLLQAAGLYSTDFHVAGEMDKDIACSVEKARRDLGYAPRVSLREGMRRSIDWCRANGVGI